MQPLSDCMSIFARRQHWRPRSDPFSISLHSARFSSTAVGEERGRREESGEEEERGGHRRKEETRKMNEREKGKGREDEERTCTASIPH